eukprot:6607974-Pyramimonas_sp.AAC.1
MVLDGPLLQHEPPRLAVSGQDFKQEEPREHAESVVFTRDTNGCSTAHSRIGVGFSANECQQCRRS